MLGPQHRPPRIIETRPHHVGHELNLQLFGGSAANLAVASWVLVPPQPGRGDGQLRPRRHFQAGLFHQLSALPDRLETLSRCRIMVSAMTGCLWRTMLNVSAQLARAPILHQTKPTWPTPGLHQELIGFPRFARRHPQTAVSWRAVKPSVRSGWTDLNQKFALVEPHTRSNRKVPECPGPKECAETKSHVPLSSKSPMN